MKEGGREDRRDRGEEIGRGGQKKDGHTQAEKFVCEKCTTYSRRSLKISRDCQNGGEQRLEREEGSCAHTHAHTPEYILKPKHFFFFLQGIHLACSYKTIYSVKVHTLPRYVKIAYSTAKPTLSGLKMACIYMFCHNINQE